MLGHLRTGLIAGMLLLLPVGRAAALDDAELLTLGRTLFNARTDEAVADAVAALVARGSTDVVASMVLAVRYRRNDDSILGGLRVLTGAPIADWKDAMLWQEAHPEAVPHPTFRRLKVDTLMQIDPEFGRFLGGEKSNRDAMKIRLEEIAWGGVAVDGIPALDNPTMITADKADYLRDDDLVFGVAINGDARAYPLRILGWHEMFNDTVGGVPVALAYCTLCGAGILFESQVSGRTQPFVFGSSGLLYRSNKLMFDRETDSLWNQFTGRPVVGPLADSGIALKIRPRHHRRLGRLEGPQPGNHRAVAGNRPSARLRIGRGLPRILRQSGPDVPDRGSATKAGSSVRNSSSGIRDVAAARAWPINAFEEHPVINDRVGLRSVVLIGDAETRTVRAYDRGERAFGPLAGAGAA